MPNESKYKDLVKRAVSNAHRVYAAHNFGARPLWSHIQDMFGTDHINSIALCKEFGINPYELTPERDSE